MNAQHHREFREHMERNLQKELAEAQIEGVLVEVFDKNGELAIFLQGDEEAKERAKYILSHYEPLFV